MDMNNTFENVSPNGKRLLIQFCDQMNALQEFCKLYDAGKDFVAQDIAVKLRLLFLNTKTNKSLIGQLGLKSDLMLSVSNPYNEMNLAPHIPLVAIQIGAPPFAKYSPHLNPFKFKKVHMTRLSKWWSEEIIIVDSKKVKYTREKLIREIVETDGGAHVDPKLKEDYFNLTRNNSIGWVFHSSNGDRESLENIARASVRTIAEEVLTTLNPLNEFDGIPVE